MAAKTISKWANEGQQWLFERGAAPTLLVGGINSGKTAGCVLKSIALLIKYPGSRMAVIRRSYTQLLKTTMESWYQWCSPDLYSRGNRKEGQLDLNNGSRVYFIHLDQPNSLDLLAGLELNFAYVSQAEEISEKAFDLLDVRVGRWTNATIPQEDFDAVGGPQNWPWKSKEGDVLIPPRFIFAEGYVTDEGHWLFRRFAEESPERGRWKALGYESKLVNTEDNVFAIQANVDAALAKDDDYVRRYVRPKWGNPEGKIFLISKDSIIEPTDAMIERIIRTMKLHRSLDHGEFVPTCCLWHATDSHGNIFVYREYYKADQLVSTHRTNITQLSKEDGDPKGRYHSNYADPQIFAKTRGRTVDSPPTWAVSDDYTDTRVMPRETALYWQPAENDESATRSRMKEYLRIDPYHRNPVTGRMGAPRLYFIKKTSQYPFGCDKVIGEIGAQMRVKSKIGDREIWLDKRDEDVIDHAYDACKYFVVGRPGLGPPEPEEALAPGLIKVSDYEVAPQAARFRKRLQERRDAAESGNNYRFGG